MNFLLVKDVGVMQELMVIDMEAITNEQALNEFKILWQNSRHRNTLARLIKDYFGADRAERLINILQNQIEIIDYEVMGE